MASDSSDPSKNASLANLKPYGPGVCGNPGGKSPEREALRIAAADYTHQKGKEAVERIYHLMMNARSEKVQADCAKWIAEQVVGKALVAISGPDGGPIHVGSELVEQLAKLSG